MDNYEAITKMTRQQLTRFLDDVYVTGINTGLYAAETKTQEERYALLDGFPYDEMWLASDAGAALCDGDSIVNESAEAALRLAGGEE